MLEPISDLRDMLVSLWADVRESLGLPLEDSTGILAVLLIVLALIFQAANHPVIGKFFKIVPALLFCYFIPTTLTSIGVFA